MSVRSLTTNAPAEVELRPVNSDLTLIGEDCTRLFCGMRPSGNPPSIALNSGESQTVRPSDLMRARTSPPSVGTPTESAKSFACAMTASSAFVVLMPSRTDFSAAIAPL